MADRDGEQATLEVVIPADWKDGVKLATTLESGQRVLTESGAGDTQTAHAAIHGGGPAIMGISGYEVVGDTIVSSDGLKTITATLYRKGDEILVARDIDSGKVKFKLQVK